jgi:hypothetical protein
MENLGCIIVEQTSCKPVLPEMPFSVPTISFEGRDADQSYPLYLRLLSASGTASKRRY